MRRWLRRAASLRTAALTVLAALACSAAAAARPDVRTGPAPAVASPPPVRGVPAPVTAAPPKPAGPRDDASADARRSVRIALVSRAAEVRLTSSEPWRLYAADGRTLLAVTQAGERWVLERDGRRVSARREDSHPVTLRDSPVIARPMDARGAVSFNGRRWRGELRVSASEGGLQVVNHVALDDYLRGVVPLEIGTTAQADMAAAEAQAVTARSYAMTHVGARDRGYDMLASVADQVYGGVNAETALGNRAVESTTGLVLMYDGRVVNAPYHAACGGSTAEPQDVWRASAEPYLKRVSDQVPGSTRFYCDRAPKYRWTKIYSGDELRATLSRYLRTLPGGGAVGTVKGVTVTGATPAGRVSTLTVDSDRGAWTVRGDAIRSALRSPSGDLLYSTYFSLDMVTDGGGVRSLTVHGGGNGHGVGMCQAGAIGRARAGQDFRTILRTYYPGTTVGALGTSAEN